MGVQMYPNCLEFIGSRCWGKKKQDEDKFKGTVHPKIKILSSFTHPCVISNQYELFLFHTMKVYKDQRLSNSNKG